MKSWVPVSPNGDPAIPEKVLLLGSEKIDNAKINENISILQAMIESSSEFYPIDIMKIINYIHLIFWLSKSFDQSILRVYLSNYKIFFLRQLSLIIVER